MTVSRFLFITLTLSFLLMAPPILGNSGQDARHNEAAALYEIGEYGKAYKQYVKLGKKGDRFSQYRVSYMHLNGLGTREDVVESLAWAVLAAQNGEEELASYQNAVAAMVPENKRQKAQQKADYYMRRWGGQKSTAVRNTRGSCTSSRIASHCKSGSSPKNWIAWQSNTPGDLELKNQIEMLNQTIESKAEQL